MKRSQWPLSPTGMVAVGVNPTLPIFRAAVERDLDRASRRNFRVRAMPFSQADGQIASGSGEIIQVHSGDEPFPAERDVPSTSQFPI